MYIKPIVAIMGSTCPLDIIIPINSPQTIPIPIAIKNSRKGLLIISFFKSSHTVIPDSAQVDATEISIPPRSSTFSIPSARIIITALFFNISPTEVGVRKDGLLI